MELFFKYDTDNGIDNIVSYRDGKISFLSDVPVGWENGFVKNFITPDGHKPNFGWENKKLTYLCIEIGFGRNLTINPCSGVDREFTIDGKEGEKIG